MPPQWLMLLKLLSAAIGYSLIALLIWRGLGKRYAAFLALIFLHSASWVTDGWLPTEFRVPAFIVATVAGWILYAYVVCEIFGRLFGHYPGIARTGQRVIAISMILALSASIATADLDFGNNLSSTGVLIATIGERVVSVAIIGYLILILVFLRWMPVPVPENTVRHTVIFFFYFVASALILHFWNRVARQTDREMVNTLLAGASTVCYAAWAWFLRAEGEYTVPAHNRPPTPDAERILGQLESINRALGRSMAGH